MPVIDASVYVSIANEADRQHERCWRWFEQCVSEDRSLVAPSLLVPEVAAAIRRLTGDEALAMRAVHELLESQIVEFFPLTNRRSHSAAEVAAIAGVRGADAVYLALAKERHDTLVTLDRQQLKRGADIAEVILP